jgi:hypothetical protein
MPGGWEHNTFTYLYMLPLCIFVFVSGLVLVNFSWSQGGEGCFRCTCSLQWFLEGKRLWNSPGCRAVRRIVSTQRYHCMS